MMRILGGIRWLKILLEVVIVSKDGAMLNRPCVYLAFSGCDGFLHAYKIFPEYRKGDDISSIHIFAPLSRKFHFLSCDCPSALGSGLTPRYTILAKRYYGSTDEWLVNEFEWRFYKWPFVESGAGANIYTATFKNLDYLVRNCAVGTNKTISGVGF